MTAFVLPFVFPKTRQLQTSISVSLVLFGLQSSQARVTAPLRLFLAVQYLPRWDVCLAVAALLRPSHRLWKIKPAVIACALVAAGRETVAMMVSSHCFVGKIPEPPLW